MPLWKPVVHIGRLAVLTADPTYGILTYYLALNVGYLLGKNANTNHGFLTC